MITLLRALGWAWLIAALSIDAMAFLVRPVACWYGPIVTIFSAYLWAPALLLGYGMPLLARWWCRDE
jgi:hypothetical protein